MDAASMREQRKSSRTARMGLEDWELNWRFRRVKRNWIDPRKVSHREHRVHRDRNFSWFGSNPSDPSVLSVCSVRNNPNVFSIEFSEPQPKVAVVSVP